LTPLDVLKKPQTAAPAPANPRVDDQPPPP
jgi:hypothetical protein